MSASKVSKFVKWISSPTCVLENCKKKITMFAWKNRWAAALLSQLSRNCNKKQWKGPFSKHGSKKKKDEKSLIPCRPKNWAKSRRDQIENLGSAAPWPILTFASRWTNRVGASAQNVKGKLGLFPLDPIGRHRGKNFPSRIDPYFPSSDDKKSFPIAPHFFPGAPYYTTSLRRHLRPTWPASPQSTVYLPTSHISPDISRYTISSSWRV